MDKEIEEKIKELQLLEQNLNNLLFQKQAFQLELNEITSAAEELKNSNGEVFKIVGNIMIKSNKEKLKKELNEKKDIVNLRFKNIEKQDKAISERVSELRKLVMEGMK